MPDPDVSLFLHGPQSSVDVQIVWRADLPVEEDKWEEVVSLSPTKTLEAASNTAPAAARAWLTRAKAIPVADIEGQREPSEPSRPRSVRRVLRWRGPDDAKLVVPDRIKPGDTIVIPANYGGADEFGWEPSAKKSVQDVGDLAALLARGKPVLRIHPDVIAAWPDAEQEGQSEALRDRVRLLLEPASTGAGDVASSIRYRVEILASIAKWPGYRPGSGLPVMSSSGNVDRKCSLQRRIAFAHSGRFFARNRAALSTDRLRAIVEEEKLDDEDTELLADSDLRRTDPGDDGQSFRRRPRGDSGRPLFSVLLVCRPDLPARSDCRSMLCLIWTLPGFCTMWQRLTRGSRLGSTEGTKPPPRRASTPAGKIQDRRTKIAAQCAMPPCSRAIQRVRGTKLFPYHLLAGSDPSPWANARVHDMSLVDHLIGTHHGWGRPFWPVAHDAENPTVTCKLNRTRPFWISGT